MFDTMTMTKVVGAFCAAMLVLFLGKFVSGFIYVPGHHDGDHAQGYKIDTGVSAADEGPAEEIDVAALIAAADVAKGENVFKKCKACHKLEDGANGTGPHLYNVVDRAVSVVDGFAYSGKLVAVADTWSAVNLFAFLENPKKYAPGTKMAFAGLKKPADRANLIAYLATIGN